MFESYKGWDDPRLKDAGQFTQIFREEYLFKHYKHLFLVPCVGINYGPSSRFGLSLLNLGESHYQYEERSILRTETFEIFGERAVGPRRYGYTTKAVAAVINKTPGSVDIREFFEQTANANYLQTYAGIGPRNAPSAQQWEDSAAAFWELLRVLNPPPDLMIVHGARLWRNMPKVPLIDILTIKADRVEVREYATDVGKTLAVAIRHPSAAFSPPRWHEVITAAMELVHRRKSKH